MDEIAQSRTVAIIRNNLMHYELQRNSDASRSKKSKVLT